MNRSVGKSAVERTAAVAQQTLIPSIIAEAVEKLV
jgi:hypothetical protein